MKKLILAGFFVTAYFYSCVSHAALFDDKEARKKILEVEQTMLSQNQLNQASLAELKKQQQLIEERLTALEAIAKNGLIDMQAQLEALKQENARFRGDLELAQHQLELAQQRQKDLYTDTDGRLRKLETVPSSAPSAQAAMTDAPAEGSKETEEQKLLQQANMLSKEAKHKDAFAAYDKFLKDYPSSTAAPEAMYGLGYTQFALKNYKSSIATQQKLLEAHPESSKVPEAMLNMANSQIQLGQIANAKKTLRDLVKKYPNHEVNPTAQKRLKALESIN